MLARWPACNGELAEAALSRCSARSCRSCRTQSLAQQTGAQIALQGQSCKQESCCRLAERACLNCKPGRGEGCLCNALRNADMRH